MPTILALCAHPDDAEFRCGGTLILLARRGWQVHIATCSTGDCGSAELKPNAIAVTRRAEARNAAAFIGGTYHCLNGLDLQIYDNDVMRGAATALIREVQPDCIITHYPVDYMPDHDAASAITRCASFTASIPNYVVGPASAMTPTAGVVPLYYFGPLGGTDYFGNPVTAPWFIDISGIIDDKAEMLARHESQREWLRAQHKMDQYIEEMKKWDADAGRHAGVPYAEGFFQHQGHGYPQTPIIQDALRELVRR
jgi:LmbE family N-acetylglucosaminyl deacetylase